MKSNRKRLWAVSVILAAVGLGLLVGCGGGGGGSSQDFIVGEWELYAVSESYSGEKVPVENAGIIHTVTFSEDGTWVDFWAAPGVPPGSDTGPWTKFGDDYIAYQPGEDDAVLYREGSQFYTVEIVEGFGLVWGWYRIWGWYRRT